MKLALISLDGSLRNTKVVNPDSGEELEGVIGFTLDHAYDADGKPLPYMLLNVTVRIEDEPEPANETQ